MTVDKQPIEKLKRVYRVLDVPVTASALAIKSNYRKLIKRWHPDRPATGAATAAEATMMTKLINEAYGSIQNAPLRYYAGNEAQPGKTTERRGESRTRNVNEADLSGMFFDEKRIEYAVRIVCGAISGVFVGAAISVDFFRTGQETLAVMVLGAVGFAWGALRYGDKFWRYVFGRWCMWE